MSIINCDDNIKKKQSTQLTYENETQEIFKENSANFINRSELVENKCRQHKFLKNYQNINMTLEGYCNSGSEVARRRWQILAKALNRPVQTSTEAVSVRRFTTFDIITSEPMIIDNANETATWHLYKFDQYSAVIRQPNRPLTPCALMGFNNTGNICVWPSEEALAVYVLGNIDAFKNTWVLELGGGLSCLAGLLLAKYGHLSGIRLTDGNPITTDNIRRIVGQNDIDCFVKCSVLKWEDCGQRVFTEKFKYDFILCADCLFFDNFHRALMDTIWYYLSDNGMALVMAPQRNNTLNCFITTAKQYGFICVQCQQYDDRIWQKHLLLKESNIYDENIHYPVLLKLQKSNKR